MAQVDRVKEEILSKADIAEIISQYITLTKRGGRLFGLCPFHKEKTPSFSVNAESQFFHCFGCGQGGNVIDFIMGVENLTFFEAKRFLANKLGIRYEEYSDRKKTHREIDRYQVMDVAAQLYGNWLQSDATAKEYVLSRGFSEEDIKHFTIGFAPNSWDNLRSAMIKRGIPVEVQSELGLIVPRQSGDGFYDRFRNRIMFPIRNTIGRVIAFGGRTMDPEDPAKYLNSNETPIFNKSKTLFLLDRAKSYIKDRGAVISEGYMDAISLHRHGFQQSVATLGTAITKEHLSVLKRYTTSFTLLYDGDNAGIKAAMRGVETFFETGMTTKVALLPEGEDPDDYLKKRGAEELQLLIDSALDGFEFYLSRIVAQHDPSIPKGKSDIVREMVPLLAKISEGFIRKDYIRLLAHRIGSEIPLVETFVYQAIKKQYRGKKQDDPSINNVPTKEADKGLSILKKTLVRLLAVHHGLLPIPDLEGNSHITIFSEELLKTSLPQWIESLRDETNTDRIVLKIVKTDVPSEGNIAAKLSALFPEQQDFAEYISIIESEPLPNDQESLRKMTEDVILGLQQRFEKKKLRDLLTKSNGDFRASAFREMNDMIFAGGKRDKQ